MPKTTATVTIPAGESVSSAVDLTAGGGVTMIYMPQDWTPANISFLVSYDNVDYRDIVDGDGIEVLRSAVAGTAVLVDRSQTSAALWLKIRSGSRTGPVVQDTDSVFRLVIE